MMPIDDMLQLFDLVPGDGAVPDDDSTIVDQVETPSGFDEYTLLDADIDPSDIQEVLQVINRDVLDAVQQETGVDDLAEAKRHKRRSTELERLKRFGWERVEDKATNKRIKYSYVNRSGRTCSSLKEAMTYCREVDASA